MTSCLMPLANAHGQHIVTVEGINMADLSPVQQAMVDTNGTQCGFCTLGFIMSFTGYVLHPEAKNYEKAIAAIDGNICRCTGYKSIERAAQSISEQIQNKPSAQTTEWLVAQGFLPAYFLEMPKKLESLQEEIYTHDKSQQAVNNKLRIGGGTDLIVQKHAAVRKADLQDLLFKTELKNIEKKGNFLELGPSVTVTEFSESPIIQSVFPDLAKHTKLVSSTPIRNMATLAGNLVNASPIGDMTVFFLALGAEIVLKEGKNERQILLKDFYKGYKQLDKSQGEMISKIRFPIPSLKAKFSFEKVCKRTHLDIASVNSAALFEKEDKGLISKALISAGGVFSYPRFLEKTGAFLVGKSTTPETLKEACDILQTEISPISDAGGTAEYKRLLLRQLFLAHFQKEISPSDFLQILA